MFSSTSKLINCGQFCQLDAAPLMVETLRGMKMLVKLLQLKKLSEPMLVTLSGIDISEKSIAIAKESYPNCDFYVGDMLNLPFKENEFDFIFSSLAISHVADKDKVFKELYRVLDNDGELLFSVGHPIRFATEKVDYNNSS